MHANINSTVSHNRTPKQQNKNKIFIKLVLLTFFILCFSYSYSQSPPPLPQRTITVQATQALHFGTFALTGGGAGTVTVGHDGIRTSNSNIFLSPTTPSAQPAIFDIKFNFKISV
mgnify:CR=1 FL=1